MFIMVHDVQDQYCLNNEKCELIYGKSWVVIGQGVNEHIVF
jgi:hypothetical protein